MSWESLASDINRIVSMYDVGGIKQHLGDKSHRAVINALKRYSEFVSLPTKTFFNHKNGKIVIIGGGKVKKNALLGIVSSLNLSKDRFEFTLDYGTAKSYEYQKLRYNSNYRMIMFGAVPHKTSGTGGSSSIISELENKDGYPRVVRFDKLTKSSFRKALEELIAEDYL